MKSTRRLISVRWSQLTLNHTLDIIFKVVSFDSKYTIPTYYASALNSIDAPKNLI